MAKTLNGAFKEFMRDSVNLDSEKTRKARKDRDNLRERIQNLEGSVEGFPKLATNFDINFGSFARRTKKRPLDDVDMFFGLDADGCTYYGNETYGVEIHINNPDSVLNNFKDAFSNTLNSRKLLNKFKASAKDIPYYANAELNRRQEAVALKLLTRDWVFDVVPCFLTSEDIYGKTRYLIPDGNGGWKRSDPRVDRDRVTRINQEKEGHLLPLVRLVKFWNRRQTMPTMSSYLLENMVVNYAQEGGSLSYYMDLSFKWFLDSLINRVYNPVADPKGLYGDLNDLSFNDQVKVSEKARSDYEKAVLASEMENSGEEEKCIKKWKEILGPEFPDYG